MKIKLLKKFQKKFLKLNKKNQNNFFNKLNIFQKNPFKKSLNNHKLT